MSMLLRDVNKHVSKAKPLLKDLLKKGQCN